MAMMFWPAQRFKKKCYWLLAIGCWLLAAESDNTNQDRYHARKPIANGQQLIANGQQQKKRADPATGRPEKKVKQQHFSFEF